MLNTSPMNKILRVFSLILVIGFISLSGLKGQGEFNNATRALLYIDIAKYVDYGTCSGNKQ